MKFLLANRGEPSAGAANNWLRLTTSGWWFLFQQEELVYSVQVIETEKKAHYC